MGSRVRIAIVAVMTIATVAMVAPAGAQSPALSRREATIRYWTPARVAHAQPRDIVVDGPPTAPARAKGGHGRTTTAFAWTLGGLVQDTTGKVLFTLNGTDYVCSGSVVHSSGDRSLVLTAGHCVNDGNQKWATNWMFVPDFQDSNHDFDCTTTKWGCWTYDTLVTSADWATNGDLDYDFAFAIVHDGGKTSTATLDLASTVGYQNIVFGTAPSDGTYSFGYPQARPFNGNSLIYCTGTATADLYSADYGLPCGMTGGSSGGPWYTNFSTATAVGDTVSLNSFYYRFDRQTMYGPYFGTYAHAVYDGANGYSGSELTWAVPQP